MKIRTSIIIGLAILFGTVMSILAISNFKGKEKATFAQQEIPVAISQLILPSGAVPVRLDCAKVFINQPDRLDTFSCKLINNSNKNVLSAIITYSIVVENGENLERTDHQLTVNAFIHPDLVTRLIEPNRVIDIKPSGPFTKSGVIIKRLDIKLETVEIENSPILGVRGMAFEKVINIRQGALKYKNWLKREFKERGNNIQEINRLLEATESPTGLPDISSRDEENGANIYRRRLRKLIQKQGLGRLSSVLNQ